MSETNPITAPQVTNPEENNELLETKLPKSPFNEMAIAFSGGGFRASAFSLGAISYLNHSYLTTPESNLLKHIEFITSTSGGSITNALYSLATIQPGYRFQDFYEKTKSG